MRAKQPDQQGVVERDGVRVAYEVFGATGPTVLLLTPWAIGHARLWKGQVPYLARRYRVVVVDGRGNGRSDRPQQPQAYTDPEYVADAVAVADATETDRAVVVGWSLGARWALQLAAWHPSRVLGVVAIGISVPDPGRSGGGGFDEVRASYEGWEKFNRNHWRADFGDFLDFFLPQVYSEPHSTKQIEDGRGWALHTDVETLIHTVDAADHVRAEDLEAIRSGVHCPVLVVHGDADPMMPYDTAVHVADWTGGSLITIPGGGHAAPLREPVLVNRLIRGFAESVTGWRPDRSRWTPGRSRPRRALFICSPIGLGHAMRDIAIADELRALHPDLQVHWLTQHPVTAVLAARGEQVHPASGLLASESAHLESECGEHDLHVFQAYRRMDEILVANFMVFHDLVTEEPFDLVVADEGWDIDHFLHENPELKRSPLAWLTDFVGWLPMPDGGMAETALTADYNAEMIEHIARYPRLRDRSIFVGSPEDLVTDPLGPGLPTVRDWTTGHFEFAGYVTGFTPPPDRDALRAELGYRPDERVCVVTVGGSGVGGRLLSRVAEAFPLAEKRIPGLRMVAVAGPRIDPASVRVPAGVELHGHVPGLHRHLAACDVAVVQGGLTTTMELVAARRPFLYFPLQHHFEQQIHVPYRLDRYRAGRRMDYHATDPDQLADAIATQIDHKPNYRPVQTDGAARAAAMLAQLL